MEPSEKEAIRSRIDLIDVISRYTVLKKAGGSKFKGLCPFHNEKTPSFHVDPENGRWRCFGACSEGGDVFKFLEKAENLTFMEAVERLAAQAGVTLSRGGTPAEREASKERQSEKDRVYSANAEAGRFFREAYQRAKFAQEYALGRGLTHQTLQDFQVGFAPDDWSQLADFLIRRGVHPEDAEKAGLIFPSRRGDGTFTDKFRGRLMFPIVDVQERVVAFGGRQIVEPPPGVNAPKYLNSPETPVFSKSKILYGLNRARKAVAERDLVLVVEGYMDVVACHQAGIEFAVATLGTSLTDEHVRMIRRYTKNVVLSFDSDDAGVRAALRAAELFEANAQGGDFSLRVLSLPEGEDPDSLLLKRGDVAGFHKAIDKALTVPEFRLLTIKRRFDTRTDEGKMGFLMEAVGVIGEMRSPLEQDLLIRRMAPLHPSFASGGATRAEESIRAEVRRHRGRTSSTATLDYGDAPPAENDFGGGGALRGPIYPADGGGRPAYTRRYGNGDGSGYPAPRRNGGGEYTSGGRPDGFSAPLALTPEPGAPVAPAPDAAGAIQRAERTVLRALLSEEWCKRVSKLVTPDLFADQTAARLVGEMLPGLVAGNTPAQAIQQIEDPQTAALADAVILSDDNEPLTDQAIADCLLKLRERRKWGEIRQIGRQVTGSAGGSAPADDELLRQWEQRVRAAKRGDGTESGAGQAPEVAHDGGEEDSAR